jgi:catechol 2,3-dioxygenase-like lactoylglutathione lyase family enzyme
MITAMHTLIYVEDADAARTFFRDVLRFPHADTGGGWLIFKTGPSELGVHPNSWPGGRTEQAYDVSLVCDDLEATLSELAGRGATFGEVHREQWGTVVTLDVPGSSWGITLYEPTYQLPALADDDQLVG